MKLNKQIILVLMVSLLAPIVLQNTVTLGDVSIDDIDSPAGVEPGLTLKYDINELDFGSGMAIENVTLPDFAGHQVYVKVLEKQDVTPELSTKGAPPSGILIYYALGLIVTQDATFIIGEGLTSQSVTLPAGSITPAVSMNGAPHFNDSAYIPPALFFMNEDWAEHETILTLIGFSVVNNNATSFEVERVNGTSTIGMAWRKSDGVLTDLHIANEAFMSFNLTDGILDLSLASSEMNALDIAVDDEIVLTAEVASLLITGTGDLYSYYENLGALASDFTDPEQLVADLQGSNLVKFVVTEVHGLFYVTEVFGYDMDTQALVSQGYMLFCGFMGLIPTSYPFIEYPMTSLFSSAMFDIVAYIELIPLFAPAITPDWDLYAGYMILADTLVGTYLDDFLVLASASESSMDVVSLDGSFTFKQQGDYYFLMNELYAEVNAALDSVTLQVKETATANILIQEEGWVGFTDTGILAGVGLVADIDITIDSSVSLSSLVFPSGSLSFDLNIRLVNEDYDVPIPNPSGGIIPGYTWIVAIPAILGISIITVIVRKRK